MEISGYKNNMTITQERNPGPGWVKLPKPERNPGPGWVKLPKPERNPGPGWVKLPKPELIPSPDRVEVPQQDLVPSPVQAVPTQLPEKEVIPQVTQQPVYSEGDTAWATQLLGEVEKNPDLRAQFATPIAKAERILGIGSQQSMAGVDRNVVPLPQPQIDQDEMDVAWATQFAKSAEEDPNTLARFPEQAAKAEAILEDVGKKLPSGEKSLTQGILDGLRRGGAAIESAMGGGVRAIGELGKSADEMAARHIGIDQDYEDAVKESHHLLRRQDYIEWAKKKSQRADKYAASHPASPSAQGFQPGNLSFWTEGIAEFVPQLLAQMAAASATAGGSVYVQLGAFAGVGGGIMGGGAYNAARKRGMSPEGAAAEAGLIAAISSALDLLPGSVLLKKTPIAKRVFDAFLKKSLGKSLKEGAKHTVAGGITEGITEALQEAWSDTVQSMMGKTDAFEGGFSRYARAGALGGAAGAGMAATGAGSGVDISDVSIQNAILELDKAIDNKFISKETGAKLGLKEKTRSKRMNEAKERVEFLEGFQDIIKATEEADQKETQDATKVPADQRGPEATGEIGGRSPADRGSDLRRQGPDEKGTEGAGQAVTGQVEKNPPPIGATESSQITTQPPMFPPESSQVAPEPPQIPPQPEVTQSTKKSPTTQEGPVTETGPELLPKNAPYGVVKEEAAKLGVKIKGTRPELLKAVNAKKIDDAAAKPNEVAKPKEVAPQADRPGKTGIKVEALESQSASEGVAPPSPAESRSAIESVEDAISRHTEDADKSIQGRAYEIIDDPDSPISSDDAANLAASLDYHRRKADEADDRYNDLMAEGKTEAAEAAATEVETHRSAEKTAAQAARFAGSQWSHIGHIYQLLIDKAGSAHVERTLRKANQGKEVDPEFANEWSKDVSKTKKEQSKRGKEIEAEASSGAANSIIKELELELRRERTLNTKKRGAKNRIVTQEKKDAAVDRIKKRVESLGATTFSTPVKPAVEMIADAAIVASYHIEAGARTLAEFTKAMTSDLGAWVKPHLDDLHIKARAAFANIRQGELRKVLSASKEVREQHRAVSEMAKEILAEHRKPDGSFIGLEEVLDILHPEIQALSKDISRREVNDMLGGYGKYKELSKDELDVAYRDRRGEARTTAQVLDLEQKKAPKRSGMESHPPSDLERANAKKVRELKKQGEREGWYDSNADPKQRLKSLLESRKTRLRNEIKDLDAQIEAGRKAEKQKKTPVTDSEIETLIEQRDRSKSRLDAMDRAAKELEASKWESEGGAYIDPDIEAYVKSLKSEIKSLESKIKSGDVFPKKKFGRKRDQRTDIANARLESLRAERDLVRKTLDPDYETNRDILRAEKQAEREVAKLESEKERGFPLNEKRSPLPETERLKKAKAELESLRQQRKDSQGNELALRAAIAQSTRNAVNVAERLAKGDFAKKKRKPKSVWDDPAWKKAKDKELDLRKQLANKIAEYEWTHAHPIDKTLYGTRVVGGAWKGWLAGGLGDLSFIGIQSGMLLGSPQHIARALLPTAKAAMSPKARARRDAQMQADPDYAKMKKWGLALREHGQSSTASADIELFPTDGIVDKIPGVAIGERIYSTGMNEIRFNLMKGLMWSYSKSDGRLLNSDTGPALARVVNALTMAWKPRSKKMQAALNSSGYLFWAPSMYVARAQLLTASPVWANRGADARIRKLAALQLIKGSAAIMLIHSTFNWLWGDDEQENSPLSSDFTKVVSGDVHVTMPTGIGQMVTLSARLMEQALSNITGREPKTSKGKRTQATARSLVGNTASYKLNPWISMLFDLTSGKDVLGRPATVASKAAENMTPLAMQNLIEAVEERGLVEGTAIGAIGYAGMPSSIYNNSDPKSEGTFLATVQRLTTRMFGKDPSGLKEKDMDKWVETKIDWDTDLSKANNFLTPKQLKRAENRVSEKKGLVAQGVGPKPVQPIRKKHQTAAAYKKVLEKHPEKIEKWTTKIEKFQAMRESLNLSHEESQKLLVKSLWKVKIGVKGSEYDEKTGLLKDSYIRRGKALAKLYGHSEKDFMKWYKTFKKGRRAARSKWEKELKNTP
jgi:hypothetical protein